MAEILKAYPKDGKMLVTVRGFKPTPRTRLINCTEDEFYLWRASGMFIQDAMPNTSADDREFLISGTTPEEWEEMFGDKDD